MRNKMIAVILILFLMNGVAYANDMDSEQFSSAEQEVLFTFGDFPYQGFCDLVDFEFDSRDQTIYLLGSMEDKEDEARSQNWNAQYVYPLDEELVSKPRYAIEADWDRIGIEFTDHAAIAIDNTTAGIVRVIVDETINMTPPVTLHNLRSFRVKGNHIVYRYTTGLKSNQGFVLGTLDPFTYVRDEEYDFQNYIDIYDLSADGDKLIYMSDFCMAGEEADEPPAGITEDCSGIVLHKYNFASRTSEEVVIKTGSVEQKLSVLDMVTTDHHIVIEIFDNVTRKERIERYTYEGVYVDGIELNGISKNMTEGPDGSILYLQKISSDPSRWRPTCDDPWQVVKINWEGKSSSGSDGGPRQVVQEKTRSGLTMARFADSQFGLLRLKEPETGIVDYQAPIRSTEKQVKLQIPYCDIQTKRQSGARNLLVDYQDQTLIFPMEHFACDDLLASMPCQDDATIEITMHTNEMGQVTYKVQLFVVEQVNGMTKVVHRKMIQ